MQNILNVTALNTYIRNVFYAEEMLHDISVAGEVSGSSVKGNNLFFDLKDENCKIPCTCFGVNKVYLPKDGEAVVLFGSVDFWQKTGKMSFIARSIKPIGEGALALKLEFLKKRLAAEGYFDEGHKKPIPLYPKRVCVLTSLAGAVKRDIVTTIRAKNSYTDIDIVDVPVQGVSAAAKICEALAKTDGMGYDVIVIARGGGSMEELMPFNDEALVKAVYAANTPIISAVGHETDYTLCDLVADVRAATPTAAGNLLAFNSNELIAFIYDTINSCKNSLEGKIMRMRSDLVHLSMRMSARSRESITLAKSRVFESTSKIAYSAKAKLQGAEGRLKQEYIRLKMLDPKNMLSRGYFIIHKKSGEVTRIAELAAGDEITVTGSDGKASATVKEVKYDI